MADNIESDISKGRSSNYPHNLEETALTPAKTAKPPRFILEGIYAFPPNRDTLGATAYFIVETTGNILLDCPAWDETNRQFLIANGGVRWLFLTHRGGISKQLEQIRADLDCEIVIQEQEAYLLPQMSTTSFEFEISLTPNCYGIWTPGFSPGSSCLYCSFHGGILFSGRHLLPRSPEEISPLRAEKTFHWLRQLRSVELLQNRFTSESLEYICPGANTGFLRGKGAIDRARERLLQLDLEMLRQS